MFNNNKPKLPDVSGKWALTERGTTMKHTNKYYAKKAVEYAQKNTPIVDIPQSVYDKGYFAVDAQMIEQERRTWETAHQWWNDNAESLIPGLAEDEDEAIELFQSTETMIWKSFPNRNKFVKR